MNNIDVNLKRWIECIQSERLEDIIKEIQEISYTTVNEKTNKHVFKLLLYLSHTADKCDKRISETGKRIFTLASILCSALISIPDSNRFVSSLFHIIRCLLTMGLYKEASELCIYLQSEHLSHSDPYVNTVVERIPHLWYNAISKMFNAVTHDSKSSSTSKELKTLMRYEFDVIKIVYQEKSMKPLLAKISQYMDKLSLISKKLDSGLTELHQFITKYLQQQRDMILYINDKVAVCKSALHILVKMMHESINGRSIGSARDSVKDIRNYFKNILQADEESQQCLNQFDCICLSLLRPVEELTSSVAKKLHKDLENFMKVTRKFGFSGALKWTANSIAQILEPLILYWETCIKEKKQMCLTNDILQEIMNLIQHVAVAFTDQIWDKCKTCSSEDCLVRRDIYNTVVLKGRCINFICQLSSNDVTKETCVLAREILEENVSLIYEMKNSGCKFWTHLWSTCGVLIYNLGIICDKVYEESATLFSLLCTCLIKFEGIKHKYKYISLQNPISATLHRLSAVHYNNGMYREAMTASALNGLMSYGDPNSKAFRMWANIKYKSLSSKKITEMTMLACLKADKEKIEELGLDIDLSKYNLIQLCMKEARGLLEAKVNLSVAIEKVLDEISSLGASTIERANVVQLLGQHLLSFNHETDITKRLKSSIADLAKFKHKSTSIACSEANLEFYIFVNELQAVNQKTCSEMESTKFALYAPKASEFGENDSRDVVPAYSMINIKEDERLMSCLCQPIQKWNDSLEQDIHDVVNGWEPLLTLQTLMIAGEYSRLYRYEKCEMRAWTLAYKLASELQDYRAMIYITGRTISLRQINREWITVAKDLSNRHRDSTNADIIEAIAIFWISLADYYFEYGMQEDGKALLNDARSLAGISFLGNTAVYLYYLDRVLWNCHSYDKDIEHEQYTRYLVETLYAMVSLNDELTTKTWRNPSKYLFSYDILFSTVVNISLRMNSLLSFREICAHLVRRLKSAQTLGATIRVAEMLKSLCYIDLSRSQLADCEVKLQGLEHILNIEATESSKNTNQYKIQTAMTTPPRMRDPTLNTRDNAASPVFRKKVFELPEFLRHKNCKCYVCQNTSYHYLVFTSTQIRAQLYTLQEIVSVALSHFHGAFQISDYLMTSSSTMQLHPIEYRNTLCSTWQQRFYIVDYVLLFVNFASFLKVNKRFEEQQALDVLLSAIKICKKYKLKQHPIYNSLRELIHTIHFEKEYNVDDFSSFTVPNPSNIDLSDFIEPPKVSETICTTPVTHNAHPRKPLSIRRNKTPPLLKLTKLSMNYSDDEDNNQSPTYTQQRKSRPQRLTRRKILEEDYTNATNTNKDESATSDNEVSEKRSSTRPKSKSKSSLSKNIAPRVPPIVVESLEQIDNPPTSVTDENIESITERVKNIRLKANVGTKRSSTRITRKSKETEDDNSNKKISGIVKLFEDVAINQEPDNPKTPEKSDATEESIIVCTPPRALRSRRPILQARHHLNTETNTNKTGKLSQPIVPFNEYEADNKVTCISEGKTTSLRSSRRESAKKETQSVKTSRKTNNKLL